MVIKLKNSIISMTSEKKYDKSFKKSYLKPKYWGSWLGILFLGFLAFIPACIRDFAADVLCFLLWRVNHRMKKNVLINLTMAYPRMSEEDKLRIYRDFLRVGIKVIFGYGESFYRSGNYLRDHYLCTGREYFDEAVATGRPIVFMAPHAWAIDRCGLFLSANSLKMCTMMHTSKNEVYDWFMNSIRLKYDGKVFERSAGIRTIIKALKDGYSSFFLPDEDLGSKGAEFVDFFASRKATLVTVSRLAKLGNAIVVPMFSCYNEEKHAYEVVFGKYFDNYPSGDDRADAGRLNHCIEELITGREKQYMWFLRMYKTRPEGEEFTDIYGKQYSYDYVREEIQKRFR
ncbi:lauroyl-KDO2-lipid IV(A) myristoyltransferase [Ruminobacter amylophilus]|uniref:Lauroyl-KDO2-lipid IV(A) myristoyltransferase n=1 Tax=Ruminobacter amylophilus TaxID=867 RepID=A0A662ZKC4_9GAMM|nr:lipid A biosynthesis (KDO)2-(lauroyl)-lipid IVA acyltransferase [Ruminobacter amylophilus]SFP59633.1 lauroyl-KDO2-lipid IV(A) myristoyltransferase [Ruminobacter amylophilus]